MLEGRGFLGLPPLEGRRWDTKPRLSLIFGQSSFLFFGQFEGESGFLVLRWDTITGSFTPDPTPFLGHFGLFWPILGQKPRLTRE